MCITCSCGCSCGAEGAAQACGAEGAAQACGAEGAAQACAAEGAAQVFTARPAHQGHGRMAMGCWLWFYVPQDRLLCVEELHASLGPMNAFQTAFQAL
jgi:hypothetical protein